MFKPQWLLYVPPGFTLTNPTFCPHSVLMFCMDLRTNSDYLPMKH